jgi:hypothetical protein
MTRVAYLQAGVLAPESPMRIEDDALILDVVDSPFVVEGAAFSAVDVDVGNFTVDDLLE